ncbi:hypothetical protein ACYULU_07465 [Breznakiellaceae bacterium SP9]
MKKIILTSAFLLTISFVTVAQGFYFDTGLGVGKACTKLDGYDIVDELKSEGLSVDEIAVDFGLKAGFGPFDTIPLYVVGEIGGIGHRLDLNLSGYRVGYMQFSSVMVGGGLIFYPIPLIQLGFSVGRSEVDFTTDISAMMDEPLPESKRGFAWNVSAAVDLGSGNHGCLIGVRYFYANNAFEIT